MNTASKYRTQLAIEQFRKIHRLWARIEKEEEKLGKLLHLGVDMKTYYEETEKIRHDK